MAKRQVFYSFHFDNDVMRVQQIRNIGVIEGNTPVTANRWEEIKRKGDEAIKKWIRDNMKFKSCVIVLIGQVTASRKWVKYEIEEAWRQKKGVMGVYVHNIRCPRTGTCTQGINPFDQYTLNQIDQSGRSSSWVFNYILIHHAQTHIYCAHEHHGNN